MLGFQGTSVFSCRHEAIIIVLDGAAKRSNIVQMLHENVWSSSNIFIQHFVSRTMFEHLAALSNTMLDEKCLIV